MNNNHLTFNRLILRHLQVGLCVGMEWESRTSGIYWSHETLAVVPC